MRQAGDSVSAGSVEDAHEKDEWVIATSTRCTSSPSTGGGQESPGIPERRAAVTAGVVGPGYQALSVHSPCGCEGEVRTSAVLLRLRSDASPESLTYARQRGIAVSDRFSRKRAPGVIEDGRSSRIDIRSG